MLFTRNFQVMIGAGVALPKAIRTLSVQAKSEKLKWALLEIEKEIIKGESFSGCLDKHKDVFSNLFINMIKVGEESGTLEDVLRAKRLLFYLNM